MCLNSGSYKEETFRELIAKHKQFMERMDCILQEGLIVMMQEEDRGQELLRLPPHWVARCDFLNNFKEGNSISYNGEVPCTPRKEKSHLLAV